MAAIEFPNVDEWVGDLDKIGERLYQEAAADLVATATALESTLRAAAPKPRDGKRAATIHATARVGARRTVIDVGPTAPAFSLVFDEFGTSRKPARPFLRPALVAMWAAWRGWPR